MIACARTDRGLVRKINQDSVCASLTQSGPLPNLFLVADGMGGHKAGDFASRFLVETTARLIAESKETGPVAALRTSILEANRLLYEESLKDSALEGMGSTLVAATAFSGALYAANIGDNRLYLFRNGRLKQITRDHSLVEEMVLLGKMKRGSESYKSQKNIITRAVGIGPHVEADFFEVPLKMGDLFLLCSDGLSNMVEDDMIGRVLSGAGTIEEKADRLVELANANGGRDNIAVILAQPEEGEVTGC